MNVIFSQSRGLAIFGEFDQLRMVTTREPTDEVHLDEHTAARLMTGAMDLEAVSVYDRDALRKHLAIRADREDLLSAALLLLDGTRSPRLRQKAANFLSSKPDSDQWNWVENVLLSTSAPESADPDGAAGFADARKDFFIELSRVQRQISLVRTAWHALPHTVFGADSREQANAKVVGKGVFHALITGKANSRRSPFSPAIEAYSRELFEADSSNRESSHYLAFGALATPKQAKRTSIWDISPWRSAWLATEWVEIEAKLACDAASAWQTTIASIAKRRAPLTEIRGRLSRIFEGWDHVRNRSAISPTVDFIDQLTNKSAYEIRKNFLLEQIGRSKEPSTAARSVLPHHFCSSLDAAEKVGEFEIRSIVQAFFDADKFVDRAAVAHQSSGFGHGISADQDMARRRAVAYCVQFDRHSEMPMYCHDVEIASGRATNHLAGIDLAIWENVIRLSLSTFSLDQRFRKGGFVVIIQGYAPSGRKSPVKTSRTILVNFNDRNSHSLGGVIATVVQRLQRRLIADLSSGLPASRCGWLPVKTLAKRVGVSSQSLTRKLNEFARDLSHSGFDSNSLQVEAGQVRLNPDMVASSSMEAKTQRD